MQTAFLAACGFLLIGVILRAKLRWLASIHMPAALVSGVLALCAVQLVQNLTRTTNPEWMIQTTATMRSIATEWSSWRSALIPIIFAGLLLTGPSGSALRNLRETAQQGIAAWILILGQLAIGLLITALLLAPVFAVPPHFGQLLEVSWAGGFGSSNAWGLQHQRMNVFPGAGDLAVFFTTCGLLYGVLSGIVIVNIGLRRGWASASNTDTSRRIVTEAPTEERNAVGSNSIDPLLFQILLLALAFAVGFGLQQSIIAVVRAVSENASLRSLSGELPLFVFTLLGGWIVRAALRVIGKDRLVNEDTMHRLTGVALDLLIFVAVATLELRTIRENWAPALLLMLIGAAWVMFNVVWISRRILPRECWFELAIMNHGFATATTAQGMMLLRMVDRDLRTDAARIYALAAPLTALFIGGGLLTYMMPYALERISAIWIAAAAAAAAVVLFLVGRRLARNSTSMSS